MERLVTALAAAVCGSYAVVAAARNGFMQGATAVDGYVWAAAFAAVVVGSWFLLGLALQAWNVGQYARAIVLKLGMVLAVAFVLFNAVGYAAYHTSHRVGDRVTRANAYDVALEEVKSLRDRVAQMRSYPRWDSTDGCTNATVPKSVAYCETFARLEARLADAERVVAEGRPAVADPQAATLAWGLTQLGVKTTEEYVRKLRPIFLAVTLEIMAMVLTLASMRTRASPGRQVSVIPEKRVPKKRAALKRKKGTKISFDPSGIRVVPIDGRTTRWAKHRIANDET